MPYGVHQNSGNYSMVDGHGETNSLRPIQEWWLDTGGGTTVVNPGSGCLPEPRGENAFTYPPDMNTARDVAGAEWWVQPWYPAGPIFDESSLN